jgi:hypothetical protein
VKRFPLLAVLGALLCLLYGCAGSSTPLPGGPPGDTGGSGNGGSATGRSGLLSIVVQVPGASRLIPSAAQFVRVQVFDTTTEGNRVALNLTPDIQRPFDVIPLLPIDNPDLPDLKVTHENGNWVITKRYAGLPIKNLIVRIDSLARDPGVSGNNPEEPTNENPPLSSAERSFVPRREGDPQEVIRFILDNRITSLTIEGDAEATVNAATNPTLTAVGRVGEVPAAIGDADAVWTLTREDGSSPTGLAELLGPGGEDADQGRTTRTNNPIQVRGLGTVSGKVRVSVEYRPRGTDVGQRASFLVSIAAGPSTIAPNISGPPPGTQRIAVRITDTNDNPLIEEINADWERGDTPPIDFTKIFLPPGRRRIHVEAYVRVPGPGGVPTRVTLALISQEFDLPANRTGVALPQAMRLQDASRIARIVVTAPGAIPNSQGDGFSVPAGNSYPLSVNALLNGAPNSPIPLANRSFTFSIEGVDPATGIRLDTTDPNAPVLVLPSQTRSVTFNVTVVDPRQPDLSFTSAVTASANTGASVDFDIQ